MISKENLIDQKYYIGTCRNTTIAMWQAKNNEFIFINFQFGRPYIENIPHYFDVRNDNSDGFIPIKIVDVEYEDIKNEKFSQDYKNYFRKIYKNLENIDLNGEIWKDVVDYEGIYQISNYGRVKNIKTNILLKQNFDREYLVVGLTLAKRKTLRVHRLVAFAFKSKDYKPNLEVNHINGIKTDNRDSNLEWVTHSINSTKTFALGNKTKKLTIEMIKEIRILLVNKELNQKQIAKKYNVSESVISEIKTKKKWKIYKKKGGKYELD